MPVSYTVATRAAKCVFRLGLCAAALATLTVGHALAGTVDLGYVSYDVTSPNVAQFDITDITGPNSSQLGSPSYPVTNTITFSNLSLLVHFSNGTSNTYGASYFTTALDGISFDGSSIPFGKTNPNIVSALLTGDFSSALFNLAGGGTFHANSLAFSASITDVGGKLADGDAALIIATSGAAVPEPRSMALLLGGLIALSLVRSRRLRWMGAGVASTLALAAPSTAEAAIPVGLSTATSPSSGVAGFTSVNLTTHNLPSVAPGGIAIALAPTCAAGASGPVAGEIDTVASSEIPLPGGSGIRVQFLIPASTPKNTYFVSIKGGSGSTAFASPACSLVAVSNSSKSLRACLPTSSLAVAIAGGVTAYVPNGAWEVNNTGIQVVPIEGGGAPASVATPGAVNSCSSNPATGQTVCTANSTDVYLLSGTALTTTLTSGATGTARYSGGSCNNCGVAVNALTNTAYIAEGSSTAPTDSRTALQTLNLASNTFAPPFVTNFELSEDISVDPTRNLILSASYGAGFGNPRYQLYTLDAAGSVLQEFTSTPYPAGNFPDSAGEDCSTGIALSSDEDFNAVFLSNLNKAVFSGGTWSAPSQLQSLINTTGFSAGVTGIAVAPGVGHLGIISGEFGGNTFGAIQLPATAGSGVPALVDYVSAYLPATPDGNGFSAGYDPHTVTAYTSPINNKAYGVIADWATGSPSYLAVIDLQALLAAKREAGTAIVDPSVDLLATGIVRYVATH